MPYLSVCYARVPIRALAIAAALGSTGLFRPVQAQSADAWTPNMRGFQFTAEIIGLLSFAADSLTSGNREQARRAVAYGLGWGFSERWSARATFSLGQPDSLDGVSWVLLNAEVGVRRTFRAIRVSRATLLPFVQVGGARRSLTDQASGQSPWMEGWAGGAAAGGQVFLTPALAISTTAAYSQGTFRWLYQKGSPTRDIRERARSVMVTAGLSYHLGRQSSSKSR